MQAGALTGGLLCWPPRCSRRSAGSACTAARSAEPQRQPSGAHRPLQHPAQVLSRCRTPGWAALTHLTCPLFNTVTITGRGLAGGEWDKGPASAAVRSLPRTCDGFYEVCRSQQCMLCLAHHGVHCLQTASAQRGCVCRLCQARQARVHLRLTCARGQPGHFAGNLFPVPARFVTPDASRPRPLRARSDRGRIRDLHAIVPDQNGALKPLTPPSHTGSCTCGLGTAAWPQPVQGGQGPQTTRRGAAAGMHTARAWSAAGGGATAAPRRRRAGAQPPRAAARPRQRRRCCRTAGPRCRRGAAGRRAPRATRRAPPPRRRPAA